MRGNEARERADRAQQPRLFSIPMRGNESEARLQDPPANGKFSIPMRGNEHRALKISLFRFNGFRSP